MRPVLAGLALAAALAAPALAQTPAPAPAPKPTVTGFLADGYQIVRIQDDSQFLRFILRKDNQLVWCSVLIQSGETSSCRVLK